MLREGLQLVLVDHLFEWDDNPRQIDKQQFERLKRSIKRHPEMMEMRPLIALPDARVYAGNMRLRALRELGERETWVFVKDLDEQRAFEIAMLDNNQYGEWVPEELSKLVLEYRDKGGEVELLGFTDQHLVKLLGSDDGMSGGDAGGDPPLPESWQVLVECDDEIQQAALIERLTEEGFEVRALIT